MVIIALRAPKVALACRKCCTPRPTSNQRFGQSLCIADRWPVFPVVHQCPSAICLPKQRLAAYRRFTNGDKIRIDYPNRRIDIAV